MASSTQAKCACPACECSVDVATAVNKDGKLYCGDSCANGHPNGEACTSSSCHCSE